MKGACAFASNYHVVCNHTNTAWPTGEKDDCIIDSYWYTLLYLYDLLYWHLYTAILHLIPLFYRTDDVAKAVLQLVEEDHRNQAVYVPPEGKDVVFVEDDTMRVAKEVLGLDYVD